MFRIETNIADEWEPGLWETVDDDMVATSREPVAFPTKGDAKAALALHYKLLRSHGMTVRPRDWRVVPVGQI